MKKLVTILFILITLSGYSQQPGDTIIVYNERWECAIRNDHDRVAPVVLYKGKVCVYFDFDEIHYTLWNIKKALRFWEADGTVIEKIIKR